MEIPLARPDITEHEIQAVVSVLRTPNLSLGPKLKEFEDKIASYAGVRYAVAANSGTSALHLIVRALGLSEGDEVITTPFSFIASSNCLLFERVTPVFVDIDPQTLNLDVRQIEPKITERTKAILAVDVFGHPAEWDELERLARKYNLKLIEDSAEAIGAEYKGRKAGSFGDAAVFAFYPNKQMTTGEGGVVLTNDEHIAKLCRSLRNQGRGEGSEWLQHERLGCNYRLSDINCALGLAQLERLEEMLRKRERVAQMYNERLRDVKGVRIPYVAPHVKISWFVYVIRLGEEYTQTDRDRILQGLRARGIGCSNYFSPIHLQPFYRELFSYKPGDFPVTESVAARTIALPFYNNLTESQIDYVVPHLKALL
ncbi:MAG: DegT/DnrJ/EryC1/StrS family aminotransferase [Candidatus Bipolaricaulota bacterium]|nr:DegT/DnrJ/EryC1/StrS family aminotransferase [Candidatus Bipolaricaulota bacterium]